MAPLQNDRIVKLRDQVFSVLIIVDQIFFYVSHKDLLSISLINKDWCQHGRRILSNRKSMLATFDRSRKTNHFCSTLKMLNDLLAKSCQSPFGGIRFCTDSMSRCEEMCPCHENLEIAELYPQLLKGTHLGRSMEISLQSLRTDCPGIKLFKQLFIQNMSILEDLHIDCLPYHYNSVVRCRCDTFWDYFGITSVEYPQINELQDQSTLTFPNLKTYSSHRLDPLLRMVVERAPNLKAINTWDPISTRCALKNLGNSKNMFCALRNVELDSEEDLENFRKFDFCPCRLTLNLSFVESISLAFTFDSVLQSSAARISSCLKRLTGHVDNIAFVSSAIKSGRIPPFPSLKYMILCGLQEDSSTTRLQVIDFDSAFPRLNGLRVYVEPNQYAGLSTVLIKPPASAVAFTEGVYMSTSLWRLEFEYHLPIFDSTGKHYWQHYHLQRQHFENLARMFPNVEELYFRNVVVSFSRGNGRGDVTWQEPAKFTKLRILDLGTLGINQLCNASIEDLFGFPDAEYLKEFAEDSFEAWTNLNIFPLNSSLVDHGMISVLKLHCHFEERLKVNNIAVTPAWRRPGFPNCIETIKRYLSRPLAKLLNAQCSRFRIFFETKCPNELIYPVLSALLEPYAKVEQGNHGRIVITFGGKSE